LNAERLSDSELWENSALFESLWRDYDLVRTESDERWLLESNDVVSLLELLSCLIVQNGRLFETSSIWVVEEIICFGVVGAKFWEGRRENKIIKITLSPF